MECFNSDRDIVEVMGSSPQGASDENPVCLLRWKLYASRAISDIQVTCLQGFMQG